MKKQNKILLIIAGTVVFFGLVLKADALSTFLTTQGGTGSSTPSGILYGDNGATNHLNTVTIGSNLTFSGGTLSATGGSGNVATSTSETAGQLAYWTSTGATPATLGKVATSSPTVNAPITYSGTLGALVGGVGGSFGCTAASAGVTGCLSGTDWSTFNNKQATISATYPLVLTGTTLSTPLASTTIAQTYGTGQLGAVTFATSSDTNLGLNITNTNGAFTFAPSWLGTLANDRLTNSSVSYGGVSVSLGASDATPAFNLADATGLPISTGVSGLGANVATFLGTPSSANFASAVTGETGTGAVVFDTSPTFTTQLTTPIVTGTSYSATTTLPHASTTDFRVNGNFDLWGTVSATFSAFVAKIEAIFITNSHTYTGGTTQDFSAATVVQHSYPTLPLATSTPWTATSTTYLGVLPINQTFQTVNCWLDSGTLNVQLYYIQTGSTQVKADMFGITTSTSTKTYTTNNAVPAGSKVYVDIGTPASSPTKGSCTWDRILNQ